MLRLSSLSSTPHRKRALDNKEKSAVPMRYAQVFAPSVIALCGKGLSLLLCFLSLFFALKSKGRGTGAAPPYIDLNACLNC